MELVKNNEKAEFVTDFSDFQNSIFLLLLTFKLSYVFNKRYHDPWPNLKNLSGGLNLSRGLNMVGST